jgi:hypothetical protein
MRSAARPDLWRGCPATDISTNFRVPWRLKHIDTHPLLSCYDIHILLATTLPDRRSSQEAVLRQMQARHEKRQAPIEAANREASATH